MKHYEGIDTVLQKAVENRVVPGVAAIAANDNGVIYEGYYGLRDISKDAKITSATVFWHASQTKAVTATAAMQLVEKGKLQLDSPIGEVVPDLAKPQVLEGFEADGQPRYRPAKRPITLRHLLTHMSGMGYNFNSPELVQYLTFQYKGTGVDFNSLDLGDIETYRMPLLFDPGERWHYGVSMDWVGRAVEIASGQRLEEYMKEHIFMPLGIKDTGFLRTPAMREQLAAVHFRLPDGSLMMVPFEFPEKPSFYSGGGGLYGTALDYLTFLQMLLHDGQFKGSQILRQETVQMMKQNHVGDLQAGTFKTVQPEATNDLDFFPGMQQRWGISFLINTEQTPQGRSAGSIAWAGLCNSYYWLDSNTRACGVFMAQVLPFADPKALFLFNQFEAGIYRGFQA